MNAADSHPPSGHHAPTVTPMLRTVLLCDIVESTALVERLGDARAAALLQRHDQMLRQLIALCHGQVVDKADGVLALFERPIQALDFALRYQRGLRELGTLEGLDLKARIGLHVGDVMTWPNSPKDVLAGAKAFEVEGLAKPVAARLMNLALPGQILMSGMAQNLAQRAVGELGEAGANLRWLMHGRYSFKGVPAPMLVHEVGEPGLSPLRAPDSGAKAWRELPLWRRPPVVALEVLLLAVLGVGLFWTTMRSPPAIAFAERDWVVVADLQNRSGEPLFDDSLDTALRVGLEQSRHVNVVSELQVDRALERMLRQGQPVDRQLAIELALREGAKAVILPTVAEVGGLVRVSLEVVDPGSGVTVYSESADGRGVGEALMALDQAMARVRAQLGETLTSLDTNSLPLEQVTTADLEALRAYSLAVRARSAGQPLEALALLGQAVGRDPGFSMAWLRMGAIELANDLDKAKAHLEQADASRDRLTRRETLLLDATLGLFGPPDPMLEKWQVYARLYPDEYRAFYNYSYFSHFSLQRYAGAAAFLEPALGPRNPSRSAAQYLLGANLLADNRLPEALAAFVQADSMGEAGHKREHADAHAAQRDYAAAAKVLERHAITGLPGAVLVERLAEVSHPLDQGRWLEASAALSAMGSALSMAPDDSRMSHELMLLSLAAYAPEPGFAEDLRLFTERMERRVQGAHALNLPHRQFHLLAAGWLAAHTGDTRTARRALSSAGSDAPGSGYPFVADMAALVEAELSLASGQPQDAIERLSGRARAGNELYFLHVVLMRSHAAAGDWDSALAEADWLRTQRGRAFGEPNSQSSWQPVNVIESNLALLGAALFAEKAGRPDVAAERRREFAAVWSEEGRDLPAVKRRLASLD